MGCRSSSLLPAVLIAVSTATTVLAADLPVPVASAPAYYPPPPAHYNWSGIYLGGHVGVGLLRDVVTDTTNTAGFLNAGTKTSVSPYAVIGGPQIGVNLQFGPAVLGVEGTWTSSDISGNYYTAAIPANTQEESRSAPHWYATATGKAGYAINDLLLYAKGGAAWMHVDYTQITLLGGVLTAQQQITDNRSGWTAGAGVEYALNENLSAKLEYDYLGFGTKNYNFTAMNGGAGLPVAIKSETHMITFGVNYRFYFGGGFGQY